MAQKGLMPVLVHQSFGTQWGLSVRKDIPVAGLVGGLLLSLMWRLVLRYSAGLLAWLVVVVVTVLFVACTLLAFTKVSTQAFGKPSFRRLLIPSL